MWLWNSLTLNESSRGDCGNRAMTNNNTMTREAIEPTRARAQISFLANASKELVKHKLKASTANTKKEKTFNFPVSIFSQISFTVNDSHPGGNSSSGNGRQPSASKECLT